ncbi:MAG TPA: hypothetical protein VGZ22_23150 [Isosphaeraceae bacterium]|jgi:hypothetical protein|nr:hypothetical protein [Isosphaeraceae bacterium]
MVTRLTRSALFGLAVMGSSLLFTSAPALGQVPQPRVADVNERSGLLTRFTPVVTQLPRDPLRDVFYETRWADYPQVEPHPNCFRHNGIYGLKWAGDCTSCTYPYFPGSPGRSTMGPDCRPRHYLSRWVQNFVHPFKPVGSYYAAGCYVPVYDLDPLVTGPGPFPWPFFQRPPIGG